MAPKAIDLHCDSVLSLMDKKDLRQSMHVDVPRLKAGNVGLQVFAAYVPASTDGGRQCFFIYIYAK
jgi:microsomal dipeptidase-like Zn-dependent dipeptidase